MIKPPTIARFEQLYWVSFALSLIAKAMAWSSQAALMRTNAATAALPWLLPATTGLSIVIAVLLWFFTCRRPSVVAKWIVVVFAALGAFGVATSLLMLALGRIGAVLPAVISIVANVLYVVAAVLLFKPDAKTWFGEDDEGDELGQPVA